MARNLYRRIKGTAFRIQAGSIAAVTLLVLIAVNGCSGETGELSSEPEAGFEVRPVVAEGQEGTEMTWVGEGETTATVRVGSSIIVDEGNLESVELEETPKGRRVRVELDAEGTKKLNEAIQGESTDQLAFLINGKLISAPTIHAARLPNRMSLRPTGSEKEVKEMVERLREVIGGR